MQTLSIKPVDEIYIRLLVHVAGFHFQNGVDFMFEILNSLELNAAFIDPKDV
jgi:hypothetical protein